MNPQGRVFYHTANLRGPISLDPFSESEVVRGIGFGINKEAYMDAEANKERLVTDLRALINDAEELLKVTANQAGETVTIARQKIEQSLIEGKKALADAEKMLVQKTREAADVADDYVRDNPWSAVGIAVGVGLLLGILIRRS